MSFPREINEPYWWILKWHLSAVLMTSCNHKVKSREQLLHFIFRGIVLILLALPANLTDMLDFTVTTSNLSLPADPYPFYAEFP